MSIHIEHICPTRVVCFFLWVFGLLFCGCLFAAASLVFNCTDRYWGRFWSVFQRIACLVHGTWVAMSHYFSLLCNHNVHTPLIASFWCFCFLFLFCGLCFVFCFWSGCWFVVFLYISGTTSHDFLGIRTQEAHYGSSFFAWIRTTSKHLYNDLAALEQKKGTLTQSKTLPGWAVGSKAKVTMPKPGILPARIPELAIILMFR